MNVTVLEIIYFSRYFIEVIILNPSLNPALGYKP